MHRAGAFSPQGITLGARSFPDDIGAPVNSRSAGRETLAKVGREVSMSPMRSPTLQITRVFDGLDGGSCSTLPPEFEGGQIESADGARSRSIAAAAVIAEACDVDGDGNLDLFEIVKTLLWRPDVLKLIGLSSSSSELQVLSFFRKADLDGSGSVTRDELMAFLLEKSAGGRHKPPELASPTSVTALEYTSRQSYGFDQTGWVVGGPGGRNLNAFTGATRSIAATGSPNPRGSINPEVRTQLSRPTAVRGARQELATFQGRTNTLQTFFRGNRSQARGSIDGQFAAHKYYEADMSWQAHGGITAPSQHVFFRVR